MSAIDILGKNLNNHEARIAELEDALTKQRAVNEALEGAIILHFGESYHKDRLLHAIRAAIAEKETK